MDQWKMVGGIASTKAACTKPQAMLREKPAPPLRGSASLRTEVSLSGMSVNLRGCAVAGEPSSKALRKSRQPRLLR